ncbi:MAG TPA: long-chain fatty acid--CoA ligase [Candidatus Acidoferrum sp.]|nr:long-chain fatty acid--CoA ligase [Candidatus Acidoferrum sp.]
MTAPAASSHELDPEAIADRTTVGVFFRQAARYGDKPLIHYRQGDAWLVETWADLRRHVLAVASALVAAGVKPRDSVLLISENRVEWVYCDFAIQTIGAVTVPIYPNSPTEMAQTIAADSGATYAIASGAPLGAKLEVAGALRHVATMDGEVAGWVRDATLNLPEIAARLSHVTPEDICTIVYTSGTTGTPKGVELAHRNLVDTARAAVQVHPITDQDSSLSWLPLAHVFGRINEMFDGMVYGGETWISAGPDHLVEELQYVKPTVMCSAPRVYEKMYAAVIARVQKLSPATRAIFRWAVSIGTRFSQTENPGPVLKVQRRLADRLVLAGLRRQLTGGRMRFFISGGAALAQNIEEFFWAVGVPILNGWGLTETSSGACSNTLHQHRFLTVGKPLPGVELKIADDGEILVKGIGDMIGYHNNPEATAEVVKDGWFYTGDIGEIDADGFLKITDRKKSLFKTSGGKYIAPVQLEHELLSDPIIERAVAIGDGRPYVTALIVPNWPSARSQGLDEAQLTARIQQTVDKVNARLGHWETIKYFTLLPRDFTEKDGELSLKLDVRRKVIQEHYRDQIESMYTGKTKPA